MRIEIQYIFTVNISVCFSDTCAVDMLAMHTFQVVTNFGQHANVHRGTHALMDVGR